MKLGPKYKIAKRLGASVFEKTQGPKFALAQQKNNSFKFKPRSRSNYGKQLLEKQKVRFTYILSEKQFVKYVRKVIEKKVLNPSEALYLLLEKRLDNAVIRSGLAPTRSAARQMVSHGHITVNGEKVTIPSYNVKKGDKISVKDSSKEKGMLDGLEERQKEWSVPNWLSVDTAGKEITIKSDPTYVSSESDLDLLSVLQFYKR
jgi:small subunit ribosomal protein S4